MTETLYQLTATAAQMCQPVPVAAPKGPLDILDHWQTLIGATTGGLLGVAGAWIVAGSARNRERRIAAGMILPDLMQLVAAGGSVERAAGGMKIDPTLTHEQQVEGRAMLVITELDRQRPSLFALHTPTIGQLTDIDARLYSHLFQCQMAHRVFEDGVSTRRAFVDAMLNGDFLQVPRVRKEPKSNQKIYADWQMCVEHATLANYFLDRLVFTRWPRWCHRFRMKFFPNDLDKRSAQLLKDGTLAGAAPAETTQENQHTGG